MTAKKTRYTLTAAIGNGQPGSTVELTEAQAASPLYASRIAPIQGDAGKAVDVEALRAEIRAELAAEMQEAAAKLIADAKTEAAKLLETAKYDAAAIIAKAEAEAKAAAKK